MGEIKTRQVLQGEPHLILPISRDEYGIIEELGERDNKGIWLYGDRLLTPGLDFTEFPMRNISTTLEGSENQDWQFALYRQLKIFAEIFGFDYFSFNRHGEKWGHFLVQKGDIEYYSISPRMFRKVPMDDRL